MLIVESVAAVLLYVIAGLLVRRAWRERRIARRLGTWR